MQKTNKKRRALRTSTNITKPAPDLAVHTDSNLHLAPALRLEPSASFSIANGTTGTNFTFGPTAGAAVTAFRLAQIETQAQIALQQLATLATITVNNQHPSNNGLTAALLPHLAVLSLLNRQRVSAVGFNGNTNTKTYRTTQPYLSAAMYHHHSQQGAQPFSNGPRPPHHQPPPNQHQNRPSSDMLSQTMGFQFPRPTQLPDELESALAIRGARDMDHRLIDHMNRPNQHQNQGSGSGISQQGTYGSNPVSLTSDSQAGHQQGVDWSNYQPPTKLFASPPPSASSQAQRHQGPQQQPQSSHAGTSMPGWAAPPSESPSSQARHAHGAGGDGQGLYTPESAGSILASFGLSNEDLEVLSHYPDDQLTPDTLPFILRDIQINKSGNQKPVASSSSFSRSIHDMLMPPSRSSPLARSRSPEVPSLLTVTQTAGKVIDYGHASRSKEEDTTRETFKREPLSSERTVKMYPSSSSSAPKAEKVERRQVRLEHTESSKHGDRDYRRTSSDHRKTNRSPAREFPQSSKSRNLDRDYRRDGLKPRPSSETRSEASSRRSLSSSSGTKPHTSGKKLPTPTMISDFSAVSPKVYPHTCSLCHTQCDEEKDWVDHINTVNHTAACRDLRNKYPDWKPNLPSRTSPSPSRYGSRPRDRPLSRSISPSLSCSPTPSPPQSKHRVGAQAHRPHRRPYSPHHYPRHHHYTEHSHRLEHQHTGSHSPSRSHRTSASFREPRPDRRVRESSEDYTRSGVKRPHDEITKRFTDTSRQPPSSKAGYSSKHGPLQSSAKTLKGGMKPGTKMTKPASGKAADTTAKPPPAKKKKKMMIPASQGSFASQRLVYLSGIPKDASEQEVTDLVGSFGKINNVVLMPCSEEESLKGEGQKASVCMVKGEDAQTLANSTNLSIRDQPITASIAQKHEAEQSADTNSKPAPGPDKAAAAASASAVAVAAVEETGGNADHKTSDEKGVVLITGLPESGSSESDIIKLFQPFGTPSDIILSAPIGKALVSVPDVETAEEIVKVHASTPAKMNESELKMIHLKQHVGTDTPVALYNLLMGSADSLESPAPVGWGRLLVIRNVPNTPSGPSEVLKLVRRFGVVINSLVLSNMVICEIATSAMALSVHKRFQKFPCIIQNNPLFFSRKRDPPAANTQTKVLTASLHSLEETAANGKDGQTAATAAEEEETAQKEKSECQEEGDEKGEKTMECGDEAAGENGSKDDKAVKDEPADVVPISSAAPEADTETDVKETSAEIVTLTAGSTAAAGNDKTPAAEEASTEAKLPRVTQEMVNALLVECRTRTAAHPEKTADSTEETKTVAEEGGEKTAEETQKPAKEHLEEEEEEVKKQERERKEREARKERERKERERRALEKEERAKREREREERARREREKREEEKREWERRERERRERKRTHGEASRSSHRSDTHKQSWREEQRHREVEEEEECDDFPFNLSDFVTVDEVGDVADLPNSPLPAVPMGTTEGGEDAPTPVQQETATDTNMEVSGESTTETLVKFEEQITESEPAPAPSPFPAPQADAPNGLTSSHVTAGAVLALAASPPPSPAPSTHTHLPTCPPQAPQPETTPAAVTDSTPEVKPLPSPAASDSPLEAAADPADSSSTSPAAGAVTAEKEAEAEEQSCPNHNQAKQQQQVEEVVEEEVEEVSDKTKEQEKTQSEKNEETRAPAAETEKNHKCENHSNTEEESVKTTSNTEPDFTLPPFNPSNPVGMEFLVPKTGFFCKVCNRFFSGSTEAEINHCKSLKHYDNLQKYLQTKKVVNVSTKPNSS